VQKQAKHKSKHYIGQEIIILYQPHYATVLSTGCTVKIVLMVTRHWRVSFTTTYLSYIYT